MEPTKITDIPEEIIIYMASYLNVKEAAKLSDVSKFFAEIANSNTFWNNKLDQFYKEIGEKITVLPSDPKQEIIKMLQNKKKFSQIISYYGIEDRDEPIQQEIKSDPKFLSERFINGDTLMHQVVASGGFRKGSHLINLMESILKNGGRLDQKNCEGMTPLHLAANYCHDRTTSQDIFPWLVKEGLDRGIDFNQKDNHGRTILHLTAKNFYSYEWFGITDNVKLLIEKIPKESLDINAKDNLGFTPLDYAILSNNSAAIQTLLEAGADIQIGICSQDIDKALKLVQEREISIHERRGTLIDYSEKETIEDYKQFDFPNMPLQEAIDKFHHLFKIQHSDEIQNYLISSLQEIVRNIDPEIINTQDDNGYALIHVAVQSNQADIIKSLLEKGADPNIKNANDISPILLSLLQAREQAFHVLLNANAELPETIQDLPRRQAVILFCRSAAILETIWNFDKISPDEQLSIQFDDGEQTKSLLKWALQRQNPNAAFALLKKGATFPVNQ